MEALKHGKSQNITRFFLTKSMLWILDVSQGSTVLRVISILEAWFLSHSSSCKLSYTGTHNQTNMSNYIMLSPKQNLPTFP